MKARNPQVIPAGLSPCANRHHPPGKYGGVVAGKALDYSELLHRVHQAIGHHGLDKFACLMNTVILVHGVTLNARCMDVMARYLTRRGWKVLRPVLAPANGSMPLETLAAMLHEFIGAHTQAEERIDLVGFSMGGLVARYYLQYLGGIARTDRFISISTPHRGSRITRWLPGAGMRQMRPGSAFLQKLNSDVSALQSVACTALYTSLDMIIIPAASSVLPFAEVVRLAIPGHPLMIYHPAVFKVLARVLSQQRKASL